MADETFNPFGDTPVATPSPGGGIGTTSSPDSDFNPYGDNPVAAPEPQRPQSTTPETDSAYREVVTDTTLRYPPVTAWQKNLARIKAAASAVGGALGPPAGFDVGGWLAGKVTPEQKAAAEIPPPTTLPAAPPVSGPPEIGPTRTAQPSDFAVDPRMAALAAGERAKVMGVPQPVSATTFAPELAARERMLVAQPWRSDVAAAVSPMGGLIGDLTPQGFQQPGVAPPLVTPPLLTPPDTQTADYIARRRAELSVPAASQVAVANMLTGAAAASLATPGLPRTAKEKMDFIQNSPDPLLQWSRQTVDRAKEAEELFPEMRTSAAIRLVRGAGALAPLMLSGEAAPFVIGMQTAGEHITSDYDRLKAAGLNDEDAAKQTFDIATKSGLGQAAVWAVLPPLLRKGFDKYLVDKFGTDAVKHFVLGRVAQLGTGAPIGALARIAENTATGEPMFEGVGESALSTALLFGVTPRGGARPVFPQREAPYFSFGTQFRPRELPGPPGIGVPAITAEVKTLETPSIAKVVEQAPGLAAPTAQITPQQAQARAREAEGLTPEEAGKISALQKRRDNGEMSEEEYQTRARAVLGGGEEGAVKPSYAQVETRVAPQRVEEGAASKEPTPGRGDYVERKAEGAAPGRAIPPEAPVVPAQRSEAIYQEAVRRVDQRLGLPSDRRLRSDDLESRGMTRKDLQGLYDQEYAGLTAKQKPAVQPTKPAEAAGKLVQLQAQAADLKNEVGDYLGKKATKEEYAAQDALWSTYDQIHKIREESGEPRDFVIIGGGAGGLKAAGHAAYEGLDTLVLERTPTTGGQAKRSMELVNVGAAERGITGRDYFRARYLTAKNRGAQIRTGVDVVNLAPRADGGVDVITKSHGVIPAKRVAILTGATPSVHTDIPGFQLAGWGNAERLSNLSKGKTGIVYGAGNSATQAVFGAVRSGAKKIIIISRHKFGPEVSEDQASRINALEKQGKVQLVTGQVSRITKDPVTGGVRVTVGDKEYPAAHIENFLDTGLNTGWLPAGIEKVQLPSRPGQPAKSGPVRVLGPSLKTTMPGVYVGGDIRESQPGERKGRRIDIAEGDAAGIVTRVHDDIAHQQQTGKLPEWITPEPHLPEGIDQHLKILKGLEQAPEAVTTPSTPLTGGPTIPSVTRKEPTLTPTLKPSAKEMLPKTPPTEPGEAPKPGIPESSKSIAAGRRALMYGETGSEFFPDVSTGERVVKPAAVTRDYAGGEPPTVAPETRTPRAPPPPAPVQADMAATVEKAYNDLHADRQISQPNPAQGLSKNEIIEGGRAAMRAGVDPVLAARSDKIRADLKYGVMRAHAEDLREQADALERQAKAKPTAENRSKAEDAFHAYSDWHRDTLAQKRAADGYLTSKGLEAITEEPDIQNMTDAREAFIRANGRDWRPGERNFIQKKIDAVEKSTAARNAAMDDYTKQLREAAPHPEFDIKTPGELNGAVASILKRIFPCS